MTETGSGRILKGLFKGIDGRCTTSMSNRLGLAEGCTTTSWLTKGYEGIGNGLWLATAYYSFIVYGSEELLAVIEGD